MSSWSDGDQINTSGSVVGRLGLGPADYTFWKNGSNYEAVDRYGKLMTGGSGTSLSTIFNTAAAGLTSGGHIHFVGATTFTVDAALTINGVDKIWVSGEGPNTILSLANNVNDDIFDITDSDYSGICNMSLQGNDSNQTAGNGIDLNNDILNFRVLNCDIRNIKDDGIEASTSGSTNMYIIGNRIVSCGEVGIFLGSAEADTYIIGNDIGAITLNCIGLSSSANNVIEGNRIYMGGWNGAAYDGSVAGRGIDIYQSNRNTIVGNQIVSCALEGIRVWGGDHNNIVGNWIEGHDQYADSRAGILIDGDATHDSVRNSVVGNTLFDTEVAPTQQYGLKTTQYANYTTIQSNTVFNNATAPYSLADTYGVYDGVARSATSVDLSGAASTLATLHTEAAMWLVKATLLYTEASSADAGVGVEVGKETDRNYYYDGTSEQSKAQWYSNSVTLLANDIAAGDTVTFYSAGGKAGTGEIMLVLDYLTGCD